MTNRAHFFLATAIIEVGAGLALVTLPSVVTTMLLGATLDPPVALVVARVAGVVLVSLGLACWLARKEEHGRAASGLIAAMLLYNVATVVVLVGSGLYGIGLWPVVLLHAALAVWCGACLRSRAGLKTEGTQ